MSVTAIIWLVVAVGLTLGALKRSAWAASLYMMTFFSAPHLWWWGRDLPSIRYAFVAGFILLVSVLIHYERESGRSDGSRLASFAAVAMVVNATLVHLLFAVNSTISLNGYVELVKYVLLYGLLVGAVRTRRDLHLLLVTLAIGGAYLGYEITFNGRGDFKGGRLEDVGAPGADTANALASMLLLILPVVGSLVLDGRKWRKLLAILSAPLILNVIIMCNSRGAFLGLIGGACAFVFLARGPSRKRAVQVLLLGAVALYLLMGDPKIFDRFTTTFVGAEERDRSAASRFEFWRAGALMLADYPLGAGGGAFKFVLADRYLALAGSDQPARALHNGYLTEATDWGVQGLALKLLFLLAGAVAAYRTVVKCRLEGRAEDALVGVSYIVALVSFMIVSMFGSYMASEWTFWIVALLVRYADVYGTGEAVQVRDPLSSRVSVLRSEVDGARA